MGRGIRTPTRDRTIAVAVFFACRLALAAAEEPAGERASAPVDAVDTPLEIERALLADDARRWAELARQRADHTRSSSQAHEALDAAVARREEAAPELISRLLDQVIRADGQRASHVAAMSALAERIQDRLRRIALLTAAADRPEPEAAPLPRGALAGTWELVFLPSEQTGRASLEQHGTIVSGTYELAGGWTGSLQGTLVNRKVFLVRIDSRLGKSMELEGYLSSDGRRIRGTWLNYELAGQEGSTGHWSAQRLATPDAP
jgi:hypothetical protein